MKVYVNSGLIYTSSNADQTVPVCPNAQLVVGGWFDAGAATESIDGQLDEVRLYNRVINLNEINTLSGGFR